MSCNCGCVAINECDIYELTPLIAETRVFERKSCVIDAHEINLKSAMGAECYKALCTELKDANYVIADLPELWRDTLQSLAFKLMLAYWIYYQWLQNYGASQSSLNGETEYDTSSQDGGNAADSKKFAIKLASAKSKAEYYTKEWLASADLSFCKVVEKCGPCDTKKNMDLQSMQRV